jgi:WD40 repeat protein
MLLIGSSYAGAKVINFRAVLEGTAYTSVALLATWASAYAAGSGSAAVGLEAAAAALAAGTTTGILSNLAFRDAARLSDRIVKRLAIKGLPLNQDVERAVRLAQLRAVEASAHHVASTLMPSKGGMAGRLRLISLNDFLKRVRDWRRSALDELRADRTEVFGHGELDVLARDVRALISPNGNGNAAANFGTVWGKSGALILAELENAKISDRPLEFDKLLIGEASFNGLTWANAVTAFFAELLKTEPALYQIFSIDLLGGLAGNLSTLTSDLGAIQESLGPIGQALAAVDRRLDELTINDAALSLKLDRIIALLASVSVEEAAARLERWAGSEYADSGLTANDVRELVAEHKLFVGRTRDFEVLDSFVNGHDRGLIIVAAPPGVGKSAFLVEWMTRRRELGDFVARHIISRRAPTTVGSISVLAHLRRQVETYRGVHRNAIAESETRLADDVFEFLKAPAREGERLIVLIDGLDEADPKLPSFARQAMGEGVFVVVGVRAEPISEPEVLKHWLSFGLGSLPRVRHDLGPLTVEEVAQWLRLSMPSVRLLSEAEIAFALNRISDGIPLYLRFLIDDFVRAVSDFGLTITRDVLTKMPASFSDYVQAELRGLDRLDNPTWGPAARKLFALLTQVRGPISAREMGRGGLVAPELLSPGRLDHRLERWFSIAKHGSERTFAFAHPHLAKVFGEVLDYEAEEAQTLLCAYCSSWAQHYGAYALAHAPHHLLTAAAASGWARAAVANAAAPLLSADFHCRRLQFAISDEVLSRTPRQARALAERAETSLAEKLKIIAGVLSEAEPMVSIYSLPDRDEASRLFSVLIAEFAADLEVPDAGPALIRLQSPPRRRPSPYFLCVLEGGQGWVIGAQELADGRILSWGGGGHLQLWDAEGAPLGVLDCNDSKTYGACELRDGNLLSWSSDDKLRLWTPDGALLRELQSQEGLTGACTLRDGRVLSWGIDGSLLIWGGDGTKLRELKGHQSKINGARELTNGNILSWADSSGFAGALFEVALTRTRSEDKNSALENAVKYVSGSDCSLRLWTPDGEELAMLKRHLSPRAPIKLDSEKTQAFTPEQIEEARALLKDGIPGWDFHSMVLGAMELRSRNILSWGDGPLRLWSEDGAPVFTLEGHHGLVTGARQLRSGRILSWDTEGGLRLWTGEGVPIASLESHSWILGALAFPDGRMLSWGVDGRIRLRHSDGTVLAVMDFQLVVGVLTLDDGRLLSWSLDGRLGLWSGTGQRIVTFEGHTGAVVGALVLAGGGFLSWGTDRKLILWSERGERRATLSGHASIVRGGLELSDSRLLSWSDDGTVRLWSSEGDVLAVLAGHAAPVNGALIAESRILSWSDDGTLRLWSDDGHEQAVLAGHVGPVAGALVTKSGQLLSWGGDGTVRCWDEAGVPGAILRGHAPHVEGARELGDGRYLSWDRDGLLRVWASAGESDLALNGHVAAVRGAIELADRRLLSWSNDGTLRLWNSAGETLAVLKGHASGVRGAIELVDGRLLSWSKDGTLRLWADDGTISVALNDHDVLLAHTSEVNGALELRDGRLLSWSSDHTLQLWSADGDPLNPLLDSTASVYGALELTDGRLLSWGHESASRLWSSEGEGLTSLEGHTWCVEGALELANGDRILSYSRDGTLRLWNSIANGTPPLNGHAGEVRGVRTLIDGRFLSWSDDDTLRLWGGDGTELATLAGHVAYVAGGIALTDGRLLSWSGDGTLRLWDPEGRPLDKLEGHEGRVVVARQLPDGRIISGGKDDNSLWLWSDRGEALATLTDHTRDISGVEVLSTGNILSWDFGGVLRLWSSEGASLAVLEGHEGWVNGAMGLRNRRLLSWGQDGTLRLWSEAGALLAELKEAGSSVRPGPFTGVLGALELRDGRILSWCLDGMLRLWDAEGAFLRVLEAHKAPVKGACELRDGRLLTWAEDWCLQIWSSEGAPLIALDRHSQIVKGAKELDDGCILSWSVDGTARLWSSQGTPFDLWGTPLGPITDVVQSAVDRNRFAVVVMRHVLMIDVPQKFAPH